MKTTLTLKEFSDLSPGTVQVADAPAPENPKPSSQPSPESIQGSQVAEEEDSERFREKLRLREITPFVDATSYHRWGINE